MSPTPDAAVSPESTPEPPGSPGGTPETPGSPGGTPEPPGLAGCPACGAARLPDEQFCEACGGPLPAAPGAPPITESPAPGGASPETAATPGPVCPSCGTADPFDDGWCSVCGMKEPQPRDHEERSGPGWAGVSDKGRRHHRNEDAFSTAVCPDGRLVVVVSDGVSTTQRPDEASALAVAAAAGVLTATGPGGPTDEDFAAAVTAGRDAVVTLGQVPDRDLGPPSCTLLLAVVGDRIDLASLGDCRAYWVDGNGGQQLTVDDSWATEQLESGAMTPEQVWSDPRAHVISRWLGIDGDPGWRPRVSRFDPPGPGWLVLCSDGLWNYLSDPGSLVAAIGQHTGLADIARTLTDHANQSGGHDNITVVMVDWPVPPGGTPSPTPQPQQPKL